MKTRDWQTFIWMIALPILVIGSTVWNAKTYLERKRMLYSKRFAPGPTNYGTVAATNTNRTLTNGHIWHAYTNESNYAHPWLYYSNLHEWVVESNSQPYHVWINYKGSNVNYLEVDYTANGIWVSLNTNFIERFTLGEFRLFFWRTNDLPASRE